MDLRDRRETWNGFGEGLTRAFEMAVTPAVFGALGWLLDRWLGVLPLFTLALSLLAVIALFVRTWYGYDAEMKAHEAGGPWAKKVAR